MRFEAAYTSWRDRRLTQEDAARLLGVCDRTLRRYIDRYEDAGLEGLAGRRGSAAGSAVSGAIRRMERQALHGALPERARRHALLRMGQAPAAVGRARETGSSPRQVPATPPAGADAGHADPPGRVDYSRLVRVRSGISW